MPCTWICLPISCQYPYFTCQCPQSDANPFLALLPIGPTPRTPGCDSLVGLAPLTRLCLLGRTCALSRLCLWGVRPAPLTCMRLAAPIRVCCTKGLGTGGGKKDAWRGTMGGRSPAFPTPAPGTVAATAAASAHRLMMVQDPRDNLERARPRLADQQHPSPSGRSGAGPLRRRQSYLEALGPGPAPNLATPALGPRPQATGWSSLVTFCNPSLATHGS